MAGGLFDPSMLYDSLKERGMLPQWAPYVPAAANGVYNFENNSIIAPDPANQPSQGAKKATTSTLAHEMTHAAQYNLLLPAARAIADKKMNKQAVSPQEERFLKAAETLLLTQYQGAFNKKKFDTDENSLDKVLKAMYFEPKGKKPSEDPQKKHDHKSQFDRYRTTPKELQAHGVGGVTKGGTGKSDEPLHLNPTFATEFSILMEMFKQLPEELKGAATTGRGESVQKAREKEPLRSYYENIFADPFKPTIK